MAGGMGNFFNKAGAQVMGLDERVRQAMAERADVGRQDQMASIVKDLQERMGSQSPDLQGVGASIAERLGGAPEDYSKLLASQARGADAKRAGLYQEAAAASDPSMGVRINRLLSQDDMAGRATQAGVYGAIGGGATLGLTAAGQGLMALMGYLQQGNEVEQDRERPLA